METMHVKTFFEKKLEFSETNRMTISPHRVIVDAGKVHYETSIELVPVAPKEWQKLTRKFFNNLLEDSDMAERLVPDPVLDVWIKYPETIPEEARVARTITVFAGTVRSLLPASHEGEGRMFRAIVMNNRGRFTEVHISFEGELNAYPDHTLLLAVWKRIK